MKFKTLQIILVAFIATISPLFSQIASGTSVQVTIMGVPIDEKTKIDANYFVSDDGTINLPFIGRMSAVGMRPEALAAKIQNAYRAAEIYSSPTIQVISTAEGGEVKAQVVHLGGQVRSPGRGAFTKGLTLWQAIQSAGGATEFGSLKRVKLYREGSSQTYDITKPENMRILLKPDDTIQIPQKNIWGQ